MQDIDRARNVKIAVFDAVAAGICFTACPPVAFIAAAAAVGNLAAACRPQDTQDTNVIDAEWRPVTPLHSYRPGDRLNIKI